MSTPNNPKVADFKEALYKKRAAKLYTEHEDANVENTIAPLTEGAASIIDDVDFFLGHQQFGHLFEKIFKQHLKDFSELILNGQAHG